MQPTAKRTVEEQGRGAGDATRGAVARQNAHARVFGGEGGGQRLQRGLAKRGALVHAEARGQRAPRAQRSRIIISLLVGRFARDGA